jgi:two-component system phosphate regulon sensor histidine kinase PhoR
MTPNSISRLSFALVFGALLGAVIGAILSQPLVGAALGALAGTLVSITVDTRRGLGLLDWLRGPQHAQAPRDQGFWGELAYRIERALRQKEQSIAQERERLAQFLAAIEASPNGVMLLDDSDQIEWCNAVAAQHFGLDPVRDRLQRVTNLVRSPLFVAFLQSGDFDEPVTVPGPLGRATLSLLVRPYGEGMKLLLSQDITERERAEAMRRDFVANVSHEIRTPLTVLSGFVETLAQLPLTEPERQRVLLLMGQQTGRMQALVGDLLMLAQLEGSPRPGADRWLMLTPLLQRALADAMALSAGRHTVALRSTDDIELAGVEGELLSAVGNLLANAVRYTPEGGRIELGWAARRWPRRDRGQRHRAGRRPRAPAPPDRTLLPRRRQPLARHRRHRPRAVDRQACRATPRRRDRHPKRAGQGLKLSAAAAGAARARADAADQRAR